jgi:hypothetical protein
MKSSIFTKEVNSIQRISAKSKLSSKGFFDEITVQDFPIRGHQAFTSLAEDGSMKTLGKSY